MSHLTVVVPPPPHRDVRIISSRDTTWMRTIAFFLETAVSKNASIRCTLDVSDTRDRTYPRKPARLYLLLDHLEEYMLDIDALVLREYSLTPKDWRCLAQTGKLQHLETHGCDYRVPNDQMKYTVTARTFSQLRTMRLAGWGLFVNTIARSTSEYTFSTLRELTLSDDDSASADQHFTLPSMPALVRLETVDWILAHYILSGNARGLCAMKSLGDHYHLNNPILQRRLEADRANLVRALQEVDLPQLQTLEFQACEMEWLSTVLAISRKFDVRAGMVRPAQATSSLRPSACRSLAKSSFCRTGCRPCRWA